MGLLIFFSLLFIIVMLHEGGHLVVAKMNKVQVNVFSIGFGWRIIGIKFYLGRSGCFHFSCRLFNFKPYNPDIWNLEKLTEYRIAPIFLGGFCAMGGETKSTGSKSDLVSKSYSQKVCVALAGVGVNVLTGFMTIYAVIASKIGIVEGFSKTLKYVGFMFSTLGTSIVDLFSGNVQIVTASETAKIMTGLSFETYLLMFGVFSITLGLFNLIPFPALDGSLPLLWLAEKFHKNGQIIVHRVILVGFIILMILQLIILFFWLR